MPRRYQTPGTNLSWSTLAEWLNCAQRLEARSPSLHKNNSCQRHVEELPLILIKSCSQPDILLSTRELLRTGPPDFCQPPRGGRQRARIPD